MPLKTWVATEEELAEARARGIAPDHDSGPGEHILAGEGRASPPSGWCALYRHADSWWLDGFSAPVGERFREHVIALAQGALTRARELDVRYVEFDVYSCGLDATRVLGELGFAARRPFDRVWRVET